MWSVVYEQRHWKTHLKLAAWTWQHSSITLFITSLLNVSYCSNKKKTLIIFDCSLIFFLKSITGNIYIGSLNNLSAQWLNEPLSDITKNLTRHHVIYCMFVCFISTVFVKSCLVTPSLTSLASHQSVYLLPALDVHTSNRDQVCLGTQRCTCMSELIKYCTNPMEGFGSSQVSSPSTQKSKHSKLKIVPHP